MKSKTRVSVLGLGHTGIVYGACLAKLGMEVFCFDFNKEIIKSLNSLKIPFIEPGLKNLIKKYLNKSLFFSQNLSRVLQNKDVIFITSDISYNSKGIIKLHEFNKSIALVKKYLPKSATTTKTIYISSQVPVGTTRKVSLEIRAINNKVKVVYFQENLKYGEAIERFLNPSKVIFGVEKSTDVSQLKKIFKVIHIPTKILSFEDAELSKQALNFLLALNISFASEMSDLCERLGCNYQQIVEAFMLDKRVSKYSPINPGIGFGGTSLQRDLSSLTNLAKNVNYRPHLLKATVKVNSERISFLMEKINTILNTLNNKKIGILGLTFKPNTNATKGSISVSLAKKLLQKRVQVRGFDPTIKDQIQELPDLKIFSDINNFLKGLDLAVILTPWPEFKDIKKGSIELMNQKNILDCFNILNPKIYNKNIKIYHI